MIIVAGAGPAGLLAGWHAARRGQEVTVVEASERVGGMAGSFEVAGVRVDHGSHRLHPSIDPVLIAELRGLLGDDLQTRPRHGRIRLDGRWVAFPLQTTDLVRRLPPRFAVRAAVDALAAPLRRPRADTFAEVVRAGLGPTVAERFYRPYVRKLWDTDPADLDGELARRRVGVASPGGIVRRLVRSKPVFLYPRTGFGAISEALADAAVAAGAAIRLGCALNAIDLSDPDRVRVTVGDGSTIDADRLWSTIPLPALATMTTPPPAPDVLAAAGQLRHRAVVLAYLVLDRPQWTEFDAHYFPDPDIAVARLSEPRNYRDHSGDPPDRTVLCAEVPCWKGDAVWSAPPADLGASVADALARQGLPAAEPTHVEVRRLPRVYPVYRPGFAWDLSALELWAGTHSHLLTFGRQGLFVPDNTHHALVMGRAAAAALRYDASFDEEVWVSARDGFRSHVVED